MRIAWEIDAILHTVFGKGFFFFFFFGKGFFFSFGVCRLSLIPTGCVVCGFRWIFVGNLSAGSFE
jgi:hypothetical protein